MAARAFKQFWQSLHGKPTTLFARVTFSSGVATMALGRGITSITRNGTGTYDVVLQDKYQTLLGYSIQFKDGSAAPTTYSAYLSAYSASAGTLTIKLANTSGVATAPADTTTMLVRIDLDNSSAP